MLIQLTQEFLNHKAGAWLDTAAAEASRLVQLGVARPVTVALTAVADDALHRFAHAQALSHKNGRPALFGPAAAGDPRHSFGDWLLALARKDHRRLTDEYHSSPAEPPQTKAALNTQTGTQGGYLVPDEFYPQLLQAAADSLFWPRALVVPMASRSVKIPALNHADAPATENTACFGGVQASWTEEAVALTESEPTFKEIELIAHEVAGYAYLSNALLTDLGQGLEALLQRVFGSALVWLHEYAFLRGNGVGKPLGLTQAACTLSVTRNTGGTFLLVDAAKMLSRLIPGWDPATTAWLVHPTVLEKLFQQTATAAGALHTAAVNGRPKLFLFHISVEPTEALPPLGTAGDVVLADLGYYVIGDRRQVELAYSSQHRFPTNQGTWRFVSRVDGQPWLRSPMTLSDGSNTASPFVLLN